MRLLILGGTRFLGRAIAARALMAGHDVTCAARGLAGEVPEGARLIRIGP
jgi:nucleoside-diphosphate-sugar epimerase